MSAKRSEDRISDSEQRVRSVVESAPFPIGVYVGREMRISLANQSIIDVWGKGNDVIGKLYSDILPELDNQEIFSQLDGVFTTGIPFHARNQQVDIVIDDKLQSYYFNYSFTPLYDSNGTIYGVMNTAAEVTDLNLAAQKIEQSEKNLRNMVLQAPVAMCILLGPEHVIEVANQSMIQLWGKEEKDVMGKPVFDALPDAREQGLEKIMGDVYQTGETFKASEMPVSLLRNGKLENVYQNFVYEPYRDSDGTILGVLAISVEVTEQVLSRQKLEASEAELIETKNRLELELETGKQLQQQKDDFIGVASHELKTPLTALKSSMQLLKRLTVKETFAPKVQNLINLANSSVSKLNHLFEELLNDTRISEGQLELNKSTFTLADLINECCDHIRVMGVYEIIATGDLSLQVYADKQRMDQVLVNLINNAVKYAPWSKEVIVNIEQLNKAAKISVIDKGPGISPDKIPHLFKRYYRIDTSGIQYSGLGLGLFISSEIIRKHGGEIGVNSELGTGSEFWFTIPLGN
jgi:PAS domain S-box-containing protein